MDRRLVLVTGGNSGIGFECARRLAGDGWHVVLASRNRAASAEAVGKINAESGDGSASELGLDLASCSSVRDLAREIDARELPLSALVCNAGLQFTSGPQLSADGFETTFAANHLGHFLLTHLLLERLRANAPARIVVVSSGVHDPRRMTGMPKPAVSDMATLSKTGGPKEGEFEGRLAYVNSKLCNLWFTYELARRLDAAGMTDGDRPVSVNAYEPGLVPGSGLARDYPPALRFIWDRILPAVSGALSPIVPGLSTARKSGEALARVVGDPQLERVSAKYFPSHTRWREERSSPESYDAERARELWDASIAMTGLSPEESVLLRAAAST